jgi:hypothetical protein
MKSTTTDFPQKVCSGWLIYLNISGCLGDKEGCNCLLNAFPLHASDDCFLQLLENGGSAQQSRELL